jgi:DNA-binding PadR family transcriptional regulator
VSLTYTILIALSEGPKSGYDVARLFDRTIGFFWRARHSQIYRELTKIKEKGWVSADEVTQTGKPNKVVFTITRSGRDALLKWSRQPSEPMELKDDFLIQLYQLESIDLEALRSNLMLRLERHQSRYARYQENKTLTSEPQSLSELGQQLALEVGMRWEYQWADWCTKALERLSPEAVSRLSNVVPITSGRKNHAE